MKIVWLDVETTGLNYSTDSIIELAALYENGDDKTIFHKYSKPYNKPDNFSTIEELTGITWKYLEENGLAEVELYNQFIKWLSEKIDKFEKSDKAIFAAYNAKFDNEFMRELFRRNNDNYFGSWFFSASLDIISTVILALKLEKIIYPQNFKNETIAQLLKIELKAHSAIEDIKASRQIQIILENKIKGE